LRFRRLRTADHVGRITGHVHALLTGQVGEAPELDLLIFQRLSAKSAAWHHENFTALRAGSQPGDLRRRNECSNTVHPVS